MTKQTTARFDDYVAAVAEYTTSRFDELVSADLAKLDDIMGSIVRAAVMGTLGIEQRFGSYEIKGKGILNDLIETRVKKAIEDYVGDRIEKEAMRQISLLNLEEIISKRISSAMDYSVKGDIDTAFKGLIKSESDRMALALRERITKQLKELVSGDLRIPTNYASKLGLAVVAEMAEGNLPLPPENRT